MGTFILLLLIFFVVIPVCRLLWRGWQFHRRWKDATANLRDAYARAYGKKIDPNVGEYVAFEEIHESSSASSSAPADGKGNTSTFRAESQIEDAVWEDVR